MSKATLSFRSSRITYYGPQPCENCGVSITKMGHEFGGNAFNAPDSTIYPNTEWHVHVCDPEAVLARKAAKAKQYVLSLPSLGMAIAFRYVQGWLVAECEDNLLLSEEGKFFKSAAEAWISAERNVRAGGKHSPIPKGECLDQEPYDDEPDQSIEADRTDPYKALQACLRQMDNIERDLHEQPDDEWFLVKGRVEEILTRHKALRTQGSKMRGSAIAKLRASHTK